PPRSSLFPYTTLFRSDVVAVGEGGAHRVAVALECANAEVDRVGRVPDQYLGRILGGAPVHGAVLRESREAGGPAPHGLVQHAVDCRLGLEARDAGVELLREAAVDGGGVGGDALE